MKKRRNQSTIEPAKTSTWGLMDLMDLMLPVGLPYGWTRRRGANLPLTVSETSEADEFRLSVRCLVTEKLSDRQKDGVRSLDNINDTQYNCYERLFDGHNYSPNSVTVDKTRYHLDETPKLLQLACHMRQLVSQRVRQQQHQQQGSLCLLIYARNLICFRLLERDRPDAGGLGKIASEQILSLAIKDLDSPLHGETTNGTCEKSEVNIFRDNLKNENVMSEKNSSNEEIPGYTEDSELDWDNFFPYVEFCDSGSDSEHYPEDKTT